MSSPLSVHASLSESWPGGGCLEHVTMQPCSLSRFIAASKQNQSFL